MKVTYTYNHNFEDYSVELILELEVYLPRFPDVDDVGEIDILKATVNEDVVDYKKGQDFPINLIDADDVADEYLGHEQYNHQEYDINDEE